MIGDTAENHVCAGSRPPYKSPEPHWRSGDVHNSVTTGESLYAYTAAAKPVVNPRNAADWFDSVVPVFAATGPSHRTDFAASAAVPSTVSDDNACAIAWATPGSTACSHAGRSTCTGLPSRSVISMIGSGSHHIPSDANVAPTFDSSNALTGVGPNTNEPNVLSDTYSATDDSPSKLPGTVYDRMPRRTAMSMTPSTPTCSLIATNGVFGDFANASRRVIDPGNVPVFSTQYRPGGQPAAPPSPNPDAS